AKTSVKPLPPNAAANAIAWGPEDAPIKVEEYLDYQCPACGQFAKNFEAGIIDAFAASGKVRYEVKFMPFLEDRVGGRESRD
ncbi:thioredoxin domain-containing protein, partial [Escherichia coli]|uniref:thioredoxin domain-containing protein n=1 Tax=Escherichia coli TaxID=562 RepID=UPI0028DE5647